MSCYIVKLLIGKPLCAKWYSSKQLQAMLSVKKGGILQHWQHRLCVLSNTRLLMYKGIACVEYTLDIWIYIN